MLNETLDLELELILSPNAVYIQILAAADHVLQSEIEAILFNLLTSVLKAGGSHL